MDNYLRIYSIYDMGAERFGPLFESVNDSTAARNYHQVMDKVQPRFRRDYKLFFIGEYDMLKGVITPEAIPVEVLIKIEEVAS